MVLKQRISSQIAIKIKVRVCFAVFILFLLFISFSNSSCTPELSFGKLTVCEEIDTNTFAPVKVKNNFDINIQRIFAVIEVSGAKSQDDWKFVWINENTGEIIAESTNKYSEGDKGYIEGYLSNCLTPETEGSIIGEPGNYRADFYHNEQLISSANFIIETPVMEITDVILSRGINETGQPVDVTESFFPDDTIYTFVGLNCQISGETVGVKWYKGKDCFLGEEEFNFNKNYYLFDYIVFNITNEELWPIDDYRIEVYHNEILKGNYYFKVVKKDIPDATFNDNNIYKKEEYKFSILYPDDWNYEEEESTAGLKVNFVPLLNDINTVIHIRVLKKGYFPSEEEYSNFSDEVLREVVDLDGDVEIKSEESTGEVNGINYKEISYRFAEKNKDEYENYEIDLIFINRNNMLYLFIKIPDIYYGDFSDRVYRTMLYSLSFD